MNSTNFFRGQDISSPLSEHSCGDPTAVACLGRGDIRKAFRKCSDLLERQLPLLIVKVINKLHPEYQSSGPWTLPADYECGRRQNTLTRRTQEQCTDQSASSIFGGRNHGAAITSRNRSPTVQYVKTLKDSEDHISAHNVL